MIVLKKKSFLIYTFIAFLSIASYGQTRQTKVERARFAAFNIGFNGLIGGFGSLINRDGDEISFKNFAKGFYKGAIGGGVSHIGLSMSYWIDTRQNIAYAWPARIVNSFGSSIIQNAAENRKMFERLHFNLFMTRLEYNTSEKKFNIRLFTSSIYGLAVVSRNARFDLSKTIKSGIFYFESDDRFSSSLGSGRATGQVSSIGMGSELQGDQFFDTYAEEVAHILQYDRKVGGNALVSRLDAGWKESSTFYKNLSKYVYFDLNGPIFFVAYKVQNLGECNFFEQEAVNYSNRRINNCN